MRELTLLICFIVGWLYFWWSPTIVPYPISAPLPEPRQELQSNPSRWSYKDAEFTGLATYTVTARVLSTERYWVDPGSRYSPIDFVLGWGQMSEFSLAEKLRITQGLRFYGYSWDETPPIPPQAIATGSSNHHLVPATPEVRDALFDVNAGDVVTLTGKLIRISKENWIWQSSLTRDDTGNGSCELLWVEHVTRLHAPR